MFTLHRTWNFPSPKMSIIIFGWKCSETYSKQIWGHVHFWGRGGYLSYCITDPNSVISFSGGNIFDRWKKAGKKESANTCIYHATHYRTETDKLNLFVTSASMLVSATVQQNNWAVNSRQQQPKRLLDTRNQPVLVARRCCRNKCCLVWTQLKKNAAKTE